MYAGGTMRSVTECNCCLLSCVFLLSDCYMCFSPLTYTAQVGRSLVAYATLPESVSTAQLAPGSVFNTTAAISLTPITITAGQPNPLTGQITVRSSSCTRAAVCDMA